MLHCAVLHVTARYCTAPHGSVLYYTAGYCIALQGTALHCRVLHCTARYGTVLHCTVLHCTVRYCTALHGTVLHCTARYCIALHGTVMNCTSRYCTALHCTALHCTARYYTALFRPACSPRLPPSSSPAVLASCGTRQPRQSCFFVSRLQWRLVLPPEQARWRCSHPHSANLQRCKPSLTSTSSPNVWLDTIELSVDEDVNFLDCNLQGYVLEAAMMMSPFAAESLQK